MIEADSETIYALPPGKENLEGMPFGNLLAGRYRGKQGAYHKWECKCSCGRLVIVREGNLLSGNSKSCGKHRASPNKSHGMSETKFYGVWLSMRRHCDNVKLKGSHRYIGRGIKVCERWHTFENFMEDMFESYREGLQIERKNNDGNYEPDNCAWETPGVQANNRRTSRIIECHGQTMTLAKWARKAGMKYGTVRDRIETGWSPEEALFTPKTK